MPKIMPGQRSAKVAIGELRWLACFVDCEGCINLSVYTKTRYRKNGQVHTPAGAIHPYVGIDNTNKALIAEGRRIMQLLTDAPIRVYRKNQSNGYRPCWVVQLTSHAQMRDVLTALAPYLVGKRAQAVLMLRFLNLSSHGRGRRPGEPLNGRRLRLWTSEHVACVFGMRRLNRRYGKGEWAKAQRTTERLAPSRVKKRSALTGDRERRQK